MCQWISVDVSNQLRSNPVCLPCEMHLSIERHKWQQMGAGAGLSALQNSIAEEQFKMELEVFQSTSGCKKTSHLKLQRTQEWTCERCTCFEKDERSEI